MRLFSWILDGTRRLVQTSRVERELDEELRTYFEMTIERNVEAGMNYAEAKRAARAETGSLEAIKDHVRDIGWESHVASVGRDVRFACRLFRKHPGFALAVIATVAIGVGGTTAIFSVVDGLFLRAPTGVTDASSVRKVFIKRNAGNLQTPSGGPGSWVDYSTMRDSSRAFAGVAAYLSPTLVDLGRGAQAEQVRASVVSGDFLSLLGIHPAAGRLFLAEEDGVPGAHPVALISYSLWRSRFGGATDAVGRVLLVNGVPMEIVGVTQKGFTGIDADPVGVWLPSAMADRLHIHESDPDGDWRLGPLLIAVHYVARLTPGVDDHSAMRRAATSLAHRAESEPELDPSPEVLLTPLVQAATSFINPAADLSLWLALVAGIVLIIGCANIANLLLARAIGRRRELAIRLSIGAGRWRIARQHLTESMVLALLGGTLGVVVAFIATRMMEQFSLPPTAGQIDGRLLTFAFMTSVFTGFLFGVLPAIRAVQIDPVHALKESGTGTSRRNLTRGVLVVVQIALSLTLLIGANLFVRSLFKVNHIESGVDVDRLLVGKVDLRTGGYTPAAREAFFELALSRLKSLPQVEQAATVHFEPFYGATYGVPWRVRGRERQQQQGATLNLVGANYFEATGTRILRGRGISEIDRAGTERVAVVDEPLARLLAEDGNVVGSCVPFHRQVNAGGCTRIVGVAQRQRRWLLESESEALPTVFFARAQGTDDISFGVPAFLIRTRAIAAPYADSIHAALQTLQPDLPYVMVTPLAETIRSEVRPFRLGAMLFSMFSTLALMLACVGLCGVLGYFVSERTPEIGIRRSLGAPVRSIVALVIRQGLLPVVIGIALGLATAVAGTRYIASLLYGTDPRDLSSFGTASVLLLVVAVLAILIPAYRASRIDPMVALRSE